MKFILALSLLLSSLAFGQQAPRSAFAVRNYVINGDNALANYSTSSAGLGYGSLDRWRNDFNGTTSTMSRQAFSFGQTDVPGFPAYFGRNVVVTSAGASNYAIRQQRIEDVRTLAGKKVTLSFWAKADASKNMAVEFVQDFGTGGSSQVTGVGVTTIALTTAWKRYTVSAAIPVVLGSQTLGTDHWMGFYFWLDAGSSLNARTNSLGQQSGTFDIAQVMLNEGPAADGFVLAGDDAGGELAKAQRYYYCPTYNKRTGVSVYPVLGAGMAYGGTIGRVYIPFPVAMRTTPTSVNYSAAGDFSCIAANGSIAAVTSGVGIENGSANGMFLNFTASSLSSTAGDGILLRASSDSAYLCFPAEL